MINRIALVFLFFLEIVTAQEIKSVSTKILEEPDYYN